MRNADICIAALLLAYESAKIYLYEVALHLDMNPGVLSADSTLESESPGRMALLIHCLDATKSFLDTYLRLSPDFMQYQPTGERGTQSHATIVLIRLAFVKYPGPDPFPLRQACNVRYYMDALADHLGSIQSTMGGVRDGENFIPFRDIMARAKSWYERMELLDNPEDFEDLRGMAPMDFANIIKREPAMSLDLGFLDFEFFQSFNSGTEYFAHLGGEEGYPTS